MAVVMRVIFDCEAGDQALRLSRVMPGGGREEGAAVDMKEVEEMGKVCRDFKWNRSGDLCRQLGERLFDMINGEGQALARALEEARKQGEWLRLEVQPEGAAVHLPFELLYDNGFLVHRGLHLVRRVSDWGEARRPEALDRPLKILFMACSPHGLSPELDFEKEEDAIYRVTEDLPVDIEVEDTGSLEGLAERLTNNEYDVIHLSGHADIDKKGVPYFLMEDEVGAAVRVWAASLVERLNLNLPRLVFLSGCRSGEAPGHEAALSFARRLVLHRCPAVLGWGLPVTDSGATVAAKQLYFELSRARDILQAVQAAREQLTRSGSPDWPLLRLFSDGRALDCPLVRPGQKKALTAREIRHTHLHNSRVKILRAGFVGRRRHLQRGLYALKKDRDKTGLLLHGTGGLGKSCLAGKICERFSDRRLIVLHGRLDGVTFLEALKEGFIRAGDEKGAAFLEKRLELPEKIRWLCNGVFRENNYLILLDDFEQNLPKSHTGDLRVSAQAAPILEALLRHLPDSGKMSQLIVTSRFQFSFTYGSEDLVAERLTAINLNSFRAADERKKVAELKRIDGCPDPELRSRLIEAGRGNPRLLEDLDTLLGEKDAADTAALLSTVADKQAEFVQQLVLTEILASQSRAFQTLLKRASVFRQPASDRAFSLLSEDTAPPTALIDRGVRLGLIEKELPPNQTPLYWVTPLLSQELFSSLPPKTAHSCHQKALSYYRDYLDILSKEETYSPAPAIELIHHALSAKKQPEAVDAAGDLLEHLRESLAYPEALLHGTSILSRLSEIKKDPPYANFFNELGRIYKDLQDLNQAIEYYEQSLEIYKEIHGDKHPAVATLLNNLGTAWHALGESRKAIGYFEQALAIDKEVYGERHPNVATRLNNLGGAWNDLGEFRKAIGYYEQALAIDKEVYGERHPNVARDLNNLGAAWYSLGESRKAIGYFEQALAIDKEVYGERHPKVAIRLNNLGLAWHALGESRKAIGYYEQALAIDKEVYGERHPAVAIDLNNLGRTWGDLGEVSKAVHCLEASYGIFRDVYGEDHHYTKSTKAALDYLKQSKK